MLEIYFGTDTGKVRETALARAHALRENDEDIRRMTGDTYTDGALTELAGSSSLFGGTMVVLLDTPSENDVFAEALRTNLDFLKESENHFVVIEGALTASAKKQFEAYTETWTEFTKEKEKFNVFALSDALAVRDKKALWFGLVTYSREGVPLEELVGILFWQLKVLRLVEKTKSATEAGLKPFVYEKAKRALIKFKKGELSRLSHDLLVLYHDGHTGKRDLSLALEAWVLQI